MTHVKPAVTRNPTAKEIAEEALAVGAQVRTELTELRTQIREGAPVSVESAPDPRVDTINSELNDLVEHVNRQFAQLAGSSAGVTAFDPTPLAEGLAALEDRVGKSFTAQAKIIDSWGEALAKHETNLTEIREALPFVSDVASKVAELDEKVRLFDEAGVAPASGEDLNDVHQRINELREDLNRTREHVGTLTVPALRAAAAERVADRTVIDLHGTQVPAIYGQVHELMKLVTQLGKDKTADKKMGGYSFRSIDAAMDAVGQACRVVGVMFQPREILDRRIERYETVSKDGWRQNWTHVWVTQRYAFVSLVDGSEMNAIEMDGEARDNGDKSTSKADSMRLKYALLQALMIPVNGLPESDGRDGTEGGQTYGRGDAGESWENATPAPPRQQAGHEERHVDSRPPSVPEEVENSAATSFGYGHNPAESPGGQAHAQAAAAQAPDERTDDELAQAAYDALVGLAGLEKPVQRTKLNAILKGITAAKLGDLRVTGVDGNGVILGKYAASVNSQVGA